MTTNLQRGDERSRRPLVPVSTSRATWLVPAGLLLLGLIPVIAGVLRVSELAGVSDAIPADPRFTASPVPVVLHVAGAAIYSVLGAFQFSPGVRGRRPGWHRAAGKFLVACGLLVGLSALWLTLFYPRAEGTGELLYVIRLVFGTLMVVSVVLGYTAIRRGEVSLHRAWMTRAYAIGLGAGTQVLTQGVGEAFITTPTELSVALLMGAGWTINLAVAEWVIRGRRLGARRQLSPA